LTRARTRTRTQPAPAPLGWNPNPNPNPDPNQHLRRFGWNFGTGGWRDVRFPRVLDGGNRAVLLESFEPGEL